MKKHLLNSAVVVFLILPGMSYSYASSGTEGAAFLDIPVGAGPASLGNAYTALADDAYAPVINPAGLGFIESSQLAAQYLPYLESINYEQFSFGIPLPRSTSCSDATSCPGSALGASVQYLGASNFTGTDLQGNPTGDFSSHYASYNLSYGRALTERWAVGITGKLINAAIDNVSADAYATDIGTMYRATDKLMLAGVLTNLGTKLKFISEGDSLPLAFHAGAAYQLTHQWNLTSELEFPQTGLVSGHFGVEWQPIPMIALRTGYRTDTTKGLSALAGYTAGLGLNVWGQEFAYAWVPLGDLGNTNYFSLVLRFGESERAKRNLIHYGNIKNNEVKWVQPGTNEHQYDDAPMELMQLLNQDETHTAQLPVYHNSVDTQISQESAPANNAVQTQGGPAPSEQIFHMLDERVQ